MNNTLSDMKMTSRLFFRLLPMQVILSVIMATNALVSGLFAGRVVGEEALTAVGLYSPVNFLVVAVGAVFLSGSQIICGKFMGEHKDDELRSVFSLNLLTVFIASLIMTVGMFCSGAFDLTGLFYSNESRPVFNVYLIGQSIGVIPFIMSQQLFAFLSMEQQNRRTIAASLICAGANILFNYLLVCVLRMGTFGLALAGALSNWAFLAVLVPYFFTDRTLLKFSLRSVRTEYLGHIIRIGLPGPLLQAYQMVRGFIVNALILQHVGDPGLSAVAAVNSLLGIVWAVPLGIQMVDRVLFGVYEGEEDRRSQTNLMRTVIFITIPIMIAIDAILMLFAVPFANLFYPDPSLPAFDMAVDGFRMLPFCMPFSVFALSFVAYGQASGKYAIVHLNTVFDGVIGVACFTAILIGPMGIQGFYLANLLNGVCIVLIFIIYSIASGKRFPGNMEQLMVIPDDFGAREEDRLDISIREMSEVVNTAERIQAFCQEHGVSGRESYLGALCMEEMAGNIVSHGFVKDRKRHSVDVRVVYMEDTLILRVKDDCVPFDPAERKDLMDPDDPSRNIGIRMVYRIADEIDYQYLLGLNVLTMKIRI